MAGKITTNSVQLGDSTTATQNFVLQTNVDGTMKLARGNVGATSADILNVDGNGNVGVGTPASAWGNGKAVEVGQLGSAFWAFNNTLNYVVNNGYWIAGGIWKFAGTGYLTHYAQSNGIHQWSASTSSGVAGGTASMTAAMTLDANGKLTTGMLSAGMEINSGTYQIKTQGSGQAYIGHVTLSTALQCSFNSTSAGVSLGSAATSWGTFSDERMKDIIEPITNAAQKVCTLRAVIGKYKTDEEGVRRSFLIAQDVQAVFPEAVDTEISENLVLRYTEVIPLLVAAIKEQQALIESLTSRLTALESK